MKLLEDLVTESSAGRRSFSDLVPARRSGGGAVGRSFGRGGAFFESYRVRRVEKAGIKSMMEWLASSESFNALSEKDLAAVQAYLLSWYLSARIEREMDEKLHKWTSRLLRSFVRHAGRRS